MRKTHFIFLVFLITLSSCNTLDFDKVAYNNSKKLFEYRQGLKNIVLRNEQLQIVDSSNIEDFRIQLYKTDFKYPFIIRTENSDILRKSDWDFSDSYCKVNEAIRAGNYNYVFGEAIKAKTIYPDADLYSGISFLEGYAFEKLGLDSLAKNQFSRFLKYSGKIYSDRLRGYDFSDKDDSIYVSYRSHSIKYLNGLSQDSSIKFNELHPKHYFDPYQPGFSLSQDLLRSKFTYLPILFGLDLSKRLAIGAQMYFPLNKVVSLFGQGMFSKDMSGFMLGVPVQLYKSSDDGFGFKLTPFITYSAIDSLTYQNTRYMVDQGFFNFGTRVSAGYFIQPNISIGAYYQYFFYNEKNKFRTKSNLEIFNRNEFDISAYYNLMKSISLKAGIKNTDLVVGLFFSGWEFSYSINHNAFIFRSNMF